MNEENQKTFTSNKLPLIVLGLCFAYQLTMVFFIIPFQIGKPPETPVTRLGLFIALAVNAVFWIGICIYAEPRFNLDKIQARDNTAKVKYVFAGIGLLLLTMISYANFMEILKKLTGYDPGLQDVAHHVKELAGENLILTIAVTACLVPVIEELLFRGLLYRALKKNYSKVISAVLSGAAFSLIHMEVHVFIPLFFFGLIFAWAYEKSGSIAVPIFLHAFNNLLTVAALYTQP